MAAAPEGSFAQAFGDVSGASKKQLAALEAEYRGADVRWAEKVASAGDSRGTIVSTRDEIAVAAEHHAAWCRVSSLSLSPLPLPLPPSLSPSLSRSYARARALALPLARSPSPSPSVSPD